MRLEKLSIRKLLPTESRLRWENVISLNSNFDFGNLIPPSVVKYKRNYIMVDGHSRSVILLFNGIEFTPYYWAAGRMAFDEVVFVREFIGGQVVRVDLIPIDPALDGEIWYDIKGGEPE